MHEYIDSIKRGEMLYSEKESSLCYTPWSYTDVTIMTGAAYTGLDAIIHSGEVIQLSGLNPKRSWIIKSLSPPDARTGKLTFKCEKPLISGTGVDNIIGSETYYDPRVGCLCIGEPEKTPESETVEFCGGIIAALKDGKLLSIWAKVRIVV